MGRKKVSDDNPLKGVRRTRVFEDHMMHHREWHRFISGPYTGRMIRGVMGFDPSYVIDLIDKGWCDPSLEILELLQFEIDNHLSQIQSAQDVTAYITENE